METPLIAPTLLISRAFAGVVVLATLAHLLRRSPRAWLREWVIAWSGWLLAAAVAIALPLRGTAGGALPFILACLAFAGSLVAGFFLLRGAGEWLGIAPAREALIRRWIGMALVAGLVIGLVLDFSSSGSLPLAAAAVSAGLIAAIGCLGVVLRMITHPAAVWSPQRVLVAVSFVSVAALELAFSAQMAGVLWPASFSLLLPFGWSGAGEWLAFCGFAVAMLITEIDEERAAAVNAASQVEHLAYHDPLSGLPNRALFFDRLVVALAHAQRHRHKLAVLFLDLDRFKMINDSLGHSSGDQIIRQAAERIRNSVRREDTVARFGGDEFIVLLQIIGRAEDAGRVAQKILDALNAPFLLDGREIVLSASIGIAVHPADGVDAETIVRNADTAMYRAKETGEHAYRFYAPVMNARALEQLEMESDLRRAIVAGEFVLHYQPLIDVRDGRVYGVEALLRWNHPVEGLLGPDRFISIAESSGLIVPIGTWVLQEACRQARALQRSTGLDLVMSVNLSTRQFDQPDLASKVRAALADAGLRGRSLELEITESIAMRDIDATIRVLHELKQIGVRIAIDDFGTGYSSLSYLRRLPVDTLKLDQSFIREITVPEDGAIASGVIAMAHSLQLHVLAEGVETLGQLEFLRHHNCDRLQGYLFSRPLEIGSLEKFLARAGANGGIRVA